jgi:very-short-patch-repair endonuclease
MSIPPRGALAEVAADRHGIFTWDDWLAAGLDSGQLSREITRGFVERIHPTVYRVSGAPRTWRQSLAGAVASGGPMALASHRAAAALWELPDAGGRVVEVTAPRHRRVERRGVRVHESIDLPSMDRWVIDSIPVTGINRTLLDLARFAPVTRVGASVDDAVRRRLTGYSDLANWLAQVRRNGVRGVRRLSTVMADRPGGLVAPGSSFEAMTLEMMRCHGLPPARRQIEVRCGDHRFSIDFGWEDALVGVECDSRQHHSMPSQWEYDLWRQNLIQLEGWLLLRYTPYSMRTRARANAAEVRNAIRDRAPHLLE